MRTEDIIDSVDDVWIKGHTIRYNDAGAIENTTKWIKMTDAEHKKLFWMLLPPVELFARMGFTVSEENANYLQKIFEEDWVGGVYFFAATVGDLKHMANDISKLVINDLSSLANEAEVHVRDYMNPNYIFRIIVAMNGNKIDKRHFRDIISRIKAGEVNVDVIEDQKYASVSNSLVDEAVESVLKENTDKLDGTDKILNWLVGQVMKKLGGKASAVEVKTKIKESL